jgi:hypothetical protein
MTNQSAAILLSRQALRPCLVDEWVKQVRNAVEWAHSENLTLLSSAGAPTWEIVTAAASLGGVGLELYVPAVDSDQFAKEVVRLQVEFDLNNGAVLFHPLIAPEGSGESLEHYRDEQIVSAADVLLPVSIRPGGSIERMLEQARRNGITIDDRFMIEYDKCSRRIGYTVDASELSDEIKRLNNEYVTHWTRGFNGSWPGESLIDYYGALLNSTMYPRNAYDTLRNILIGRTIHASSRNMPGEIATVSFTGLRQTQMVDLIRYRARRREMSFEPYGVCIHKSAAERLGIRPVSYESDRGASRKRDWLCQSEGRITDWRQEDEYRCLGNFNLSFVQNSDMVAVCRFKEEAERLQDESGITTIPFCK